MSTPHATSTRQQHPLIVGPKEIRLRDLPEHTSAAPKRLSAPSIAPSKKHKPTPTRQHLTPIVGLEDIRLYGPSEYTSATPKRLSPPPIAPSKEHRPTPFASSKQSAGTTTGSSVLKESPKNKPNNYRELPNEALRAPFLDDKDADGNLIVRPCSTKKCSGIVFIAMRYKLCDKCRKRSRDNARRRYLQAKEKARMSSPSKVEDDLPVQDASALTVEERFGNFMRQLRTLGKLKTAILGKRKATDDSDSPAGGSASVKKAHLDIPEYRTEGDLFGAFAKAVAAARLSETPGRFAMLVDFRGCYCVVRDLDDLDAKGRIEKVVDVAIKKARLPIR
ncbi:uncharacterized protein PHACADRAFT_262193 [Phanerochaete carnosa HHB-10118-sp]|uniref:Uncharacterized protein n=1 Tax=Phanerochaete carnosa (strain HHB-10118-sp) TaxID=650164 RepID=K5UPV9_PHACS|nr:uncharacterized protein PHACADRAFT_262193 [Phanerochaete carnosa HHB-10118-sp]EKM51826.1 hypothetical protein PHACADRAFT_262193 [Phanerochaete carnosa HHB-10118-sp]